MINDILKAAARKQSEYEINEDVKVTLMEMSAKDQFEWASLREQLDGDLVKMYAHLIKRCCVELSEADLEDIESMSASHIIGMGDAIVEMSQKKG